MILIFKVILKNKIDHSMQYYEMFITKILKTNQAYIFT